MILTREQFIDAIKNIVDTNTNEGIKAIEDFTDTYDSMINNKDNEDWKKKYQDNDTEWRRKYIERFNEPREHVSSTTSETIRISDIFRIKE